MGLMPPVDFDSLMSQAKDLIAKKDKIEADLSDIDARLAETGVGMQEPLVDSSGFPRAEIDVHSVRIDRNQVIRLRNDHKAVMADIERILHEIHQAKRAGSATTGGAANDVTHLSEEDTIETTPVAFAIVNAVAPDSPAYSAGLRRNDRICKFGHIDEKNHQNLLALNALIGQSENIPVPVSLLRDGEILNITVTPKSGWGGRGTLGCHLLPL
ncbi:uncharacterized protein EV154DRAFT_527754 [Mucor mucedo]|uniref:uncharacterized protein n=1 Tax=Mucor mucedo TaxID=29922 RepID=UPI002220CF19|nr:uncharacterized protein EV154DRAFT_527754 [Mucor mucedo]KAI7873694.1 hypothetical protein EV154DRAFT_527754 [Mucor mucedo]